MYEEKNRPDEMRCAVNAGEPLCICDKAKRIRDISIKAKEIAYGIQGIMFADAPPMPQNEKEATCLDDELNGIFDEMQFLMETLLIIRRRLDCDTHV